MKEVFRPDRPDDTCGCDAHVPVLADGCSPPFTFAGRIHEVVIDVGGKLLEVDAATVRRPMAQQ